jgi:ERCC4-related helicase
LKLLTEIDAMWCNVNTDPKLETFIKVLKKNKHLSKNKLIVFTESKETGEYLELKLNPIFNNKVLAYSSISGCLLEKELLIILILLQEIKRMM